MEKEIIIVGNGTKNSISDDLFEKVQKGDYVNVRYIYAYSFDNPVIRWINKAYYLRCFYPFTKAIPINWEKYYSLEKFRFENNKEYILILNLGSIYYRFSSRRYLETFRMKHPNVKMVLLLIDTIDTPEMAQGDIKQWFSLFDNIITFDPKDAKKYNLVYRMLPYMEVNASSECDSDKSDIYFIGRDKGRRDLLLHLYDRMISAGIKTNFNIIGTIHAEREGLKFLRDKVPYNRVIADVKRSNCVLEILSHGAGATLRYYEAVIYNKKLLTNNPGIVELPFYNEKYMKCFSSVEEIDYEWIKTADTINYDYNGEFGLDSFFQFIRALCVD